MPRAKTVKAKTSVSNQPTLRIALVGNTGVGKSTLVNVLMGREAAKADNNVKPCTTRTEKFEVVEGGTTYRVLDTRGLNEGSEGAALGIRMLRFAGILPDAEHQVKKLLRRKSRRIDLVLLCVSAEKIQNVVNWKIYNKVYVDFGGKKLKVAVVVTRLDETDIRGSGWKETCRNKATEVVAVEEFPDASLLEGVPNFDKLNDPSVKDCRRRILRLISGACPR